VVLPGLIEAITGFILHRIIIKKSWILPQFDCYSFSPFEVIEKVNLNPFYCFLMTKCLLILMVAAFVSVLLIIPFSGMLSQIAALPVPFPRLNTNESQNQSANNNTGCNPDINNFVYHPLRLKVIQECITVTGTLDLARVEKDGDYHMLVKLDAPFANLTNSLNDAKFNGDLVVEPICQNIPTQTDAIDPCSSYNGPNFGISSTALGTHLELTGRYVLDMQHGGWAEIHPLDGMKTIGQPNLAHSQLMQAHPFSQSALAELARES
jgi:hypothetical protein